MEIVSIPVQDKYILYRPLLQLAFVGNQAMARLVTELSGQSLPPYARRVAADKPLQSAMHLLLRQCW
jgi:hypothetical protein